MVSGKGGKTAARQADTTDELRLMGVKRKREVPKTFDITPADHEVMRIMMNDFGRKWDIAYFTHVFKHPTMTSKTLKAIRGHLATKGVGMETLAVRIFDEFPQVVAMKETPC